MMRVQQNISVIFLSALLLLSLSLAFGQEATEPPDPPPTLTETPFPTELPTSTETATFLPSETATSDPTATETATLPVVETPTAEVTAEVTAEPVSEITAEVTQEVLVESTAEVTAESTEALLPTDTATATLTATASQTALPAEPDLALLTTTHFGSSVSAREWYLPENWMRNQSGIWAMSVGEEAVFKEARFTNVVIEANFQLEVGAFSINASSYSAVVEHAGMLKLYRGTTVLSSVMLWTADGGWHTLRLSVMGSIIRVAVDGIEVIAFLDSFTPIENWVSIGGDYTIGSVFYSTAAAIYVPLNQAPLQHNSGSYQADQQTSFQLQTTGLPPDIGYSLIYTVETIEKSPETYGYDFELANPDGTYTRYPLQTGNGVKDWSPDGHLLAYNAVGFSTQHMRSTAIISTLDPVSGQIYPRSGTLTGGYLDGCLSWSPDGSKIAFHSIYRDGVHNLGVRSAIYFIELTETSATTPVRLALSVDGVGSPGCPFWSPIAGSNQILYVQRTAPSEFTFFLVDALTAVTNSVFTHPTAAFNISWSPDGSRIVFQSSGDLYLYDFQTAVKYQLTQGVSYDRYPVWDPSGERIAYSSNSGINLISLSQPCSNCPFSQVAGTVPDDVLPDWSPDGRWIAVNSIRDGQDEIYVIEVEGSHRIIRLTNSDNEAPGVPKWRPGEQICPSSNSGLSAQGAVVGQNSDCEPTPTPTPPPTCSNVQQLQANSVYMMSEQGDPVCPGDDAPRPDPAETCSGFVTGNVNVRSQPSVTGIILTTLSTDTQIMAVEKHFNAAENRYWYLIDSEVDGYIAGEYVMLADPDCNLLLFASDENGTYQNIPPQPDSNLSNMCSGFFVFDEGQTLELHQQPDASSPVTFSVPDLSTVYIGAATTSTNNTTWYFVKYIERYLLDEANNGEWRFYLYSGWINRFDATLDEGCENLPAPTVDEYGNLIAHITITKAFENPTVPRHVGEEITFTISVTNQESAIINGVIVEDVLPVGLQLVEPSPTDYEVQSGVWNVGDVAHGTSKTLMITATVILPEEIPAFLDDAYKNVARLRINNSLLQVPAASAEVIAQVIPALCQLTSTNSAMTFRAPIRGNFGGPGNVDPRTMLAPKDIPIAIDAYSLDPIVDNLIWLHILQSDSATILPEDSVPLMNNWVQVNTTYNNRYIQSPTYGFQIEQTLVDNCITSERVPEWTDFFKNGLRGHEFPNIPQTITFTNLPLAIDRICAGTIHDVWGIGVAGSDQDYGNNIYHTGVDFFSSVVDTTVYSVADGLVVGIGDGPHRTNLKNPFSQNSWGSSAQGFFNNPTDGYSVIVRYGQLYVLYGHLSELHPTIYVGAPVSAAQPLGKLGTFGTSHLHIEVRSLGHVNLDGVILRNGRDSFDTGEFNQYGIIDLWPNSRGYVYDIMQFYNIQNVLNPGTADTVAGLGVNIIDPTTVSLITMGSGVSYFSPGISLPDTPTLCSRRHSLLQSIYDGTIGNYEVLSGSYWGFKLTAIQVGNLYLGLPDPLQVIPDTYSGQ